MSANESQGSEGGAVVDAGPTEIILAGSTPPEVKSTPADVTDVTPKSETTTEVNTETDDQEEDRAPRKGKGVQDRIDELTRSRREAEREAAYWRARVTGSDSAQPPAQSAAKPEPVAADFATNEDYVKALTDYKVDQRLAERDEIAAQVKEVTSRVESWQSQLAAARSEIADFNSVMDAAEIGVAPHVAELLMEHGAGAKLAYHFAQNPDVLEQINGMNLKQAAFQIGEIASKLSSSKAAPVADKPVSKAPPPPTPVGQGRTTTPTLGDMDMDSYIASRKKQGANWAR
jgi:hypothetical protein